MAQNKEEPQGDKCPHCGGPVEVGFGLAGGGYGAYYYCDKCERVVEKFPEKFPE